MTAPWNERLPTSVEVCGAKYEIRSDYRVVLDKHEIGSILS